jgi:beta-glucanase (GH16 family)
MGTRTDLNPTPLADQSAWTQVFYDGFNGSTLDRHLWPIVYGGSQNWNGAFWWDPKAIVETRGELVVSATQSKGHWIAGGTTTMRYDGAPADAGFEFQYGRVEIRAAIDAGKGTGPAMLLWPFDNTWPPEVDILETPDGQRRSAWFSNHWRGPQGEDLSHSVEVKSIDGSPFDALGTPYDGRAWHTYTLDWLPDRLVYYIDGVKLYETPAGEPVPAMPMAIGLQMFVAAANDGWYGGGPDRTTPRKVDLHVDYVKVYESEATRSTGDRDAGATLAAAALSDAAGSGLPPVARGTVGNDVLAGRPGPERFIPGGGHDELLGFEPGIDTLQLTGTPQQVKTFLVEQDGVEGLMVLYDGRNSLFLPDLPQHGGLAAGDLVFG